MWFRVGELVTDWYLTKKVLKHLPHSTISGSFTVKRIETLAVRPTIDTKRTGDSRRICSNDEHAARITSCLESRDLEVDS